MSSASSISSIESSNDSNNNVQSNSSNSSNNNIVGFKLQSNMTSPDFRADVALQSDELKNLQILCIVYQTESDFQETLLMLLLMINLVKFDAMQDDLSSISSTILLSLLSDDSDSFNPSELSLENLLEEFLDENGNDLFPSDEEVSKYTQVIAIFSTYLGVSIIDLDKFVIATIDVTAIHRGEWAEVKCTTRLPKTNRTINELGSTRIYYNTHFTNEEMQQLLVLFFGRMNTNSYTYKTYQFTYEESLLISLHYQSHGTAYNQLSSTYSRDWSKYTYMVIFFSTYLYHKFYHRLCRRSLEYWVPNLEIYRKSIWLDVCFDDSGK